ncbi:winged helix-turn-helix domain-containing protein [Pseudomonas aeruginosa]|uniref:winged helix-turn-helix domain-containing protein n=2 Tax=Pseudomonas aeruginosa TaxID=287 RepID=UPI0009A410A8|nr:winged helix-turn-helix domain-containing protein [Pseudomonas aeruginosa]
MRVQAMQIKIEGREFIPEKSLIIINGKSKHLRPKESKIILLLCENYPETLSRKTLEADVWAKDFVSEQAINQTIRDIRQSLEDKEKTIIVTHPGQGYSLAKKPEYINDLQKEKNKPSSLESLLAITALVGIACISAILGFASTSQKVYETQPSSAETSEQKLTDDALILIKGEDFEFIRKLKNNTTITCKTKDEIMSCEN